MPDMSTSVGRLPKSKTKPKRTRRRKRTSITDISVIIRGAAGEILEKIMENPKMSESVTFALVHREVKWYQVVMVWMSLIPIDSRMISAARNALTHRIWPISRSERVVRAGFEILLEVIERYPKKRRRKKRRRKDDKKQEEQMQQNYQKFMEDLKTAIDKIVARALQELREGANKEAFDTSDAAIIMAKQLEKFNAKQLTQTVFNQLKNTVADKLHAIGNDVQSFVQGVIEAGRSTTIGSVLEAMVGGITSIIETVGQVLNAAAPVIDSAIAAVQGFVQGIRALDDSSIGQSLGLGDGEGNGGSLASIVGGNAMGANGGTEAGSIASSLGVSGASMGSASVLSMGSAAGTGGGSGGGSGGGGGGE